MNCRIEPLLESDGPGLAQVFNHFVESSFAAYPDECVGPEFVRRLLQMTQGYPAVTVRDGERIVGFAMLRPYHSARTLRRTAEITYFLLPESTGQGLGRQLWERLAGEALSLGVDNILASISSRNEQSLAFHRRLGFEECGRFREVGRKFGQDFDIVWMQKRL